MKKKVILISAILIVSILAMSLMACDLDAIEEQNNYKNEVNANFKKIWEYAKTSENIEKDIAKFEWSEDATKCYLSINKDKTITLVQQYETGNILSTYQSEVVLSFAYGAGDGDTIPVKIKNTTKPLGTEDSLIMYDDNASFFVDEWEGNAYPTVEANGFSQQNVKYILDTNIHDMMTCVVNYLRTKAGVEIFDRA